jgi:hypothetical protein
MVANGGNSFVNNKWMGRGLLVMIMAIPPCNDKREYCHGFDDGGYNIPRVSRSQWGRRGAIYLRFLGGSLIIERLND